MNNVGNIADNDKSRQRKLKNDEFVQLHRTELYNLERILENKIFEIEDNLNKKHEKITRLKVICNVNDYGNAHVYYINSLIRKLSNLVEELEKKNKDLKSRLNTERTARDYDGAVFNGCI